ncbi:MAG: TetR family transcriptional regulator C-terminal domain-containing protein, partial [Leucobacter sp.]
RSSRNISRSAARPRTPCVRTSVAFLEVFQGSHQATLVRTQGVRGLAALREMFLELLPLEQDGPQRSRVVLSFWDRAAQDPELWEIHHENILERRALIRRFLVEAREDGELDPAQDIEDAVNRVSAFNAGWQMLAVLVPESADDLSLRTSIESILEALRADRAGGRSDAASAA